MSEHIEAVHLRREIRTALELAIIAFAPTDLVERLAVGAGLIEAIAELPPNAPPVLALAPKTIERGREALDAWQRWQAEHTPTRV